MRKHLFIAVMLLLPLALVAAVCGSETTEIQDNGDQPHGITVAGEGKIQAPPDVAVLVLGVSALRPTVAEARDAANLSLNGMLDSMRANGVAEEDLQTAGLSIYPEYDYRGDTQTLRGFRVSNTVTAKVRSIDSTGKVVDDAVDAGGDNTTIQGITFTIDNPESLRERARAAAVEDARNKAETLAQASGVNIGAPIMINEGSDEGPIVYERSIAADSAAQAGAPTPIEPGELDVVIHVTVTWEIAS